VNVRIDIDYDLCTGCKRCVRSCRYGVLEWLDDAPLVVNPHSCAACLDCERNCDAKAIKIRIS